MKNTARKFPAFKTARPRAGHPSARLFLPTATSARMTSTQGDAARTAGIPVEDLEPAAGLSSASSCIKLSLVGSTFRPVYLHQVFPDERIPGWRPTAEAEMEARATAGVFMHSLSSLSITTNWSLLSILLLYLFRSFNN